MGALSDDIGRLCGEIRTLRRARQSFLSGLAGQKTDRQKSLAEMRDRFAAAHAGMVRHATADRLAFLSNLRRTVERERRELRADLAGARRAWCGVSAAPPRAAPFGTETDVAAVAPARGQARLSSEQRTRDRLSKANKRKTQGH